MNYYNIVKKIKETSLQHKLVNEVSEGDIYEHLNSGDHKYPCVFLTVTSISNSTDNDIQTINGSLFYVDRLLSDKANKLHIQSNGITTLKQVFSQLQEIYDDITIGDQTYTPFEEKFADVCAGVFANFSISYENEITCSDSEYEVETKTITLTKNGIYDVIGYDTAIVNVIPQWGTIEGEITEQTDLVEYVADEIAVETSARTQADTILQGEIETKQDILTAGANIQISGTTISATDTIYDDSEVREMIAENTQAIEDEVEARTSAISTLDDAVVHKAGNETVTGFKTFSNGAKITRSTSGAILELESAAGDTNFILKRTGCSECVLESGQSVGLFGTKSNHPLQIRTNYTNRATVGTDGSFTLATDVDANSNNNQVATTKWVNNKIKDLDDFTCGQIVPTTTNFVSGTIYSIEESLQRTANLFGGQQGEINTINSTLGDCTTSNTAADKAFVNSTVATNAANFRGNFTNWTNVPTDASGYEEDYRGTKTPTNNDYMVVQDATDYATGNTGMWRFMYIGDWTSIGKNGWKPQYRVGSAFTERQQAAIDSGINSTKVAQYDAYDEDITALETDKLDKVYSSGKKVYGVANDGSQKMYTAGSNVQFNDDGTISATDTTYTNGFGISLSGTTFANSAPIFYVEGSDSDEKGIWTGTLEGLTAYYDGLTIVYVPKKAGLSSGHITTLNLNNLGEMPLYMNTTRVTTHFGANVPVVMTYYNDAFRITDYYTSQSIAVGLSTTSASAAAKTATFSYWDDKDKTYLYVTFRYANTKKAALTLNVNSTGAYPIYIDGVISSDTNYTIAAGTHIMLLYNNIYWMYSDGSIPVLDGTTVKKVTDLKYDDTVLTAQVTANTSAIATKQNTLVSGTNIKTINNQSLLGSGNIVIQGGGDGKVKKVSVHKGIPCAQHIGKDNETKLFGGKYGNQYFKPINSYWTLRKLTDSQIAILESYDRLSCEVIKLNLDERYVILYLYGWDEVNEIWDKDNKYYHDNAFIFENNENDNWFLDEFLGDDGARQQLLKNVTDVQYIQAKDGFEIRKGKVICVAEPDLYIARRENSPYDVNVCTAFIDSKNKLWRRCSYGEMQNGCEWYMYGEMNGKKDWGHRGNYKILTRKKVGHHIWNGHGYVWYRATKWVRFKEGRTIIEKYFHKHPQPVQFYRKMRKGKYTSIKHFDCIGCYDYITESFKFLQEIP